MPNVHVETLRAMEQLYKCDGCTSRALVRVRVWDTWPTYLDLCGHHANRAFQTIPNLEILEDNRTIDNAFVPA